MLLVTCLFPFHTFRIMAHMLARTVSVPCSAPKSGPKVSRLYKPGGVFLPMTAKYFSYLKPGFHPWQDPVVPSYEPWLRFLQESGDPIEAGNRLHQSHVHA